MRKPTKRALKHRQTAYSERWHDGSEPAALPVAAGETAVLPIIPSKNHPDDFDRLLSHANFDLNPLSERHQNNALAADEDSKLWARIQPTIDLPHHHTAASEPASAPDEDSKLWARIQPTVDLPHHHTAASEPASAPGDGIKPIPFQHTTEPLRAAVLKKPSLSTQRPSAQPHRPHKTQAPAPSTPRLLYVIGFTVFVLLASTCFLGYTVFQLNAELGRLNQQLQPLIDQPGNLNRP